MDPGAALAVSLLAAFLHQLLRRDGRPRLTESVAATAAGLAIVAIGANYVPLPRTLGGSQTMAAAMAAIALSALADVALDHRRLRPRALPYRHGARRRGSHARGPHGRTPDAGPGRTDRAPGGGHAHATRRVLAVLPTMASSCSHRLGAASVLVCGVRGSRAGAASSSPDAA